MKHYFCTILLSCFLAAFTLAHAQEVKIRLDRPGTLEKKAQETDLSQATSLTISGLLNDNDMKILSRLVDKGIKKVDLSQSKIQEIGNELDFPFLKWKSTPDEIKKLEEARGASFVQHFEDEEYVGYQFISHTANYKRIYFFYQGKKLAQVFSFIRPLDLLLSDTGKPHKPSAAIEQYLTKYGYVFSYNEEDERPVYVSSTENAQLTLGVMRDYEDGFLAGCMVYVFKQGSTPGSDQEVEILLDTPLFLFDKSPEEVIAEEKKRNRTGLLREDKEKEDLHIKFESENEQFPSYLYAFDYGTRKVQRILYSIDRVATAKSSKFDTAMERMNFKLKSNEVDLKTYYNESNGITAYLFIVGETASLAYVAPEKSPHADKNYIFGSLPYLKFGASQEEIKEAEELIGKRSIFESKDLVFKAKGYDEIFHMVAYLQDKIACSLNQENINSLQEAFLDEMGKAQFEVFENLLVQTEKGKVKNKGFYNEELGIYAYAVDAPVGVNLFFFKGTPEKDPNPNEGYIDKDKPQFYPDLNDIPLDRFLTNQESVTAYEEELGVREYRKALSKPTIQLWVYTLKSENTTQPHNAVEISYKTNDKPYCKILLDGFRFLDQFLRDDVKDWFKKYGFVYEKRGKLKSGEEYVRFIDKERNLKMLIFPDSRNGETYFTIQINKLS